MKKKKNIQSTYRKAIVKKNMLIGEVDKKHYVLIKGFNMFMYDHKLNHGRKHLFCAIVCKLLEQQKKLKCQMSGCFKFNGKQIMH